MNIYVGNLPLDINEEELRREFEVFGQVASVYIMNDKYIGSGQTRAYGYVVMPSHNDGMNAVAALQGKILKNRMLQVIEALPLSGMGSQSSGQKEYRYSKRPRVRQVE
jgi:RNA recognition motif-containing protein